MNTKGCRLCMSSFLENPPSSIEDSPFKEQLVKVFSFSIEPREGLPHGVCQQCVHKVSEYYHFSEQVRENQEQLQQDVVEKKEGIKIEPTEFVETKLGDDQESLQLDPESELKEEEASDDDFSVDSDKSYVPDVGKEEAAQSDESDAEEGFEPEATPKRKKRTSNTTSRFPKAKRKKDTDSEPKAKRKGQTRQEQDEQYRQVYEFYKMTCELCKHVTEDFHSLKAHFQEVHKRNGYITCCKRKLFNLGNMTEHMNLHANPNAFKCDVCNKCYSGKSNLEQHKLKAHASSDARPYKCAQCPQSFSQKHMLRTHNMSHEKMQCMECGKFLANKTSLRAHQVKMHSGIDRQMICDTCGQCFKDKVCFERHVQEHMGIDVLKRHQCHICQAWLRGERGLQLHLQFVHYDREKTHFCDICNKQYPTRTALWGHKRVVHVAEKYECEFCGAKFKQPLNLKEHRTIHTGEVLYSCEYCGKSMNSKSNFYIHTKKNHPVEWAMKRQKAEELKMAQRAT